MNLNQLARYSIYFTSAFMFLPAGRDIFAPGATLMPGDDKLFAQMFTDRSKVGYTFMWNLWGLNWIVIHVMKIMATAANKTDFMKLGLVHGVLVTGKLIQDFGKMSAVGADASGFLTIFAIETLAFAKLLLF